MRRKSLAPYLFTAPAVLMILLIAVFPVIRTFYFSLFDLRLNNPAKRTVRLSPSLDLPAYLDSSLMITSDIETSPALKKEILSLNDRIFRDSGREKQCRRLLVLLESYAPYDRADYQLPFPEDRSHAARTKLRELAVRPDIRKEQVQLLTAMVGTFAGSNFKGFTNYLTFLADGRFWRSVFNTSAFTVVSVLLELLLGMIFAMVMNQAFRGRGLFRAGVLVPWAIPTAVSAIIWRFLLDGENGIIAHYLSKLPLVENMGDLLSTTDGAFFSIVLSDVWKTTPYMALLLLAGLQSIPRSLYESASIDGAGAWQRFRYITLPLLRYAMLVALMFRTLDAFRIFDLVFVLTGGGPANSTESVSLLAYKKLFSQSNFGEGSALAVLLFCLVALISGVYLYFLRGLITGEENS